MIRDEHIEAAIAEGALTPDQAARLREIARGASSAGAALSADAPPDPDDEKFRLIGGFNDVFVTIGVGLLISALFALSGTFGARGGFSILGMVAAWGLAEIFSRRMRLALPSIALAIMFAGSAALAAFSLGSLFLSPDADPSWGYFALLLGLGATIAAAVHEWRFRVPIDVAIAAMGLFCVISGGIDLVAPRAEGGFNWTVTTLFGLGVFATAVRFDASDPLRQTRRADIAFWLHLLAAPMIVQAMMPLVTGNVGEMGAAQAVAILIVFTLLGIVAVVIDRRAMLVSGLTYAGIAIGYLITQSVEEGFGLSLTLLFLAVLVLGLSAGWKSLRRAILPLLPLGSLRAYIPPA
ncbi:hypothetical protein [Hyphomicrobium sp. CS1GBMeth3]|uniref:hypothetical protein n=1 Tax=Hyphomicrobium sp. CS1GBMeth3 TaxID=1892845 RepID=UPI0009310306|nr:hypothetical protein [Hyphomicrobium sp. CS1GBMeth3]